VEFRPGHVIAFAFALCFAAVPARAEDVLVIRDGTRRSGTVTGCRDDGCTLDGQRVARGLIAWVGLARTPDARTPAPRDPLKDEFHLTDGRVVAGEFEGLSLGAAAIEGQSFEREDVAWIRFAGPEPTPPTPGPRNPQYVPSSPTPSPSPSQSAPPPPSPPAPPSSSPRPSVSPSARPSPPPRDGEPVKPCPPGAPLGGHIVQRHRHFEPGYDCRGGAELWFDLVPSVPQDWPLVVGQQFEAREIEYRLDVEGCRPVATPNTSQCSAPAATKAGTRRSSGPMDALGIYFAPKDPALHFQSLPEEIRDGVGVPLTCTGAGSTFAGGEWRLPVNGAIFPGAVPDVGTHPSSAGPCHAPQGAERQRECYTRPDRYAVIPFRGSESWHRQAPAQARFVEGSTLWNVCCGCGRPDGPPPGGDRDPSPRPPRPSPSPSFDPCGSLAQSRSLVDTVWAQRQSQTATLERDMRDLQDAYDEMLFNLEAWRAAIGFCAIADVVQTVLTEASGKFGEVLDLAAQIADGDLSYLNDSDGLSAALEVLDGVTAVTGAGNPSNMRDRIAGCAALPPNLRAAANTFVDNYAKVLRLMPQVQQQVNWFRTQDQKYWDQWQKYYRDCQAYARCKGLPAPPCPRPPESPAGPMPAH
jgi:hypothetical protein